MVFPYGLAQMSEIAIFKILTQILTFWKICCMAMPDDF